MLLYYTHEISALLSVKAASAQGFALPRSPPKRPFTRSRMESWLGSYGCSLLGISNTAGIGCKLNLFRKEKSEV